MVEAEAKKGNDIQSMSWRGYNGFRCGQATVGRRYDGVFLQARSGTAHEYFDGIKEFATNWSRIDCAVTAIVGIQQPEIFRKSFNALRKPQKTGHRRGSVTLIANDTYGDSLMFGRRQSDRYGRFYDKGLEQRIAEGGWMFRWEVECKRDYAKVVGLALTTKESKSLVAHGVVSKYFDGFGLRSPAQDTGLSEDDLKVAHAAVLSRDSHRLAWLSQSCKPVLMRLDNCGRLEEAVSALGLMVVDGKIVMKDDSDFTN